MGDGHGGIDKVASSWTLRGWSPPWTRTTVTLCGLKSPSTWMYDSTTYRNHTKNLHVYIAFALPNTSPYLHMKCFTFRCYTLRIACVGCLLYLCKVAKIYQELKLGKG